MKTKCKCNKNAIGRFFGLYRLNGIITQLWMPGCGKHLKMAKNDGFRVIYK